MQITCKVYKLSFVVLLLQTLTAWNQTSAQETGDADNNHFRLIVATCSTCHSDDSAAAVSIPRLEGLTTTRIKQLLTAYKTDQEQGTLMNRISKALSAEEIDVISSMFKQSVN